MHVFPTVITFPHFLNFVMENKLEFSVISDDQCKTFQATLIGAKRIYTGLSNISAYEAMQSAINLFQAENEEKQSEENMKTPSSEQS